MIGLVLGLHASRMRDGLAHVITMARYPCYKPPGGTLGGTLGRDLEWAWTYHRVGRRLGAPAALLIRHNPTRRRQVHTLTDLRPHLPPVLAAVRHRSTRIGVGPDTMSGIRYGPWHKWHEWGRGRFTHCRASRSSSRRSMIMVGSATISGSIQSLLGGALLVVGAPRRRAHRLQVVPVLVGRGREHCPGDVLRRVQDRLRHDQRGRPSAAAAKSVAGRDDVGLLDFFMVHFQ